MNTKHAVVREAGKTIVITEDTDPVLGRRVRTRSSFADIRNFYINDLVVVGTDSRNEARREPLGDLWLRHPNRRQYEGIVFHPGKETPGYFNLWRGFAVEPKPGDWSLMQQHMRLVMCAGNDEHYQYVTAWMASAVQRPDEPAEVALVLRGRRGTGKGMFGRQFGALFGQHAVHVANPRHLVGNFNAHLQDAVVVFADEAFESDNKEAEGVLKMLITEPVIPIERKHRDVVSAKNMIHLLIASNEEWIVPAGLDERRFFVIEVTDDQAQNHDYFARLVAQMDNGGREAMLYDLLQFDLSKVNLRKPPATEALLEQKLFSMTVHQQWWYEKLQDGRLLRDHEWWEREIVRDELQDDYAAALGRAGTRSKGIATQLGLQLKNLLPTGYPRRTQRTDPSSEAGRTRRPRYWGFPTLAECREHFDRLTNTKHSWHEDEEHNK